MMRQYRLTQSAALSLAVAALAAPAAVAQPAHPRSLDHMGQLGQDMRNPDNRGGSAAGQQEGQDLRMPDTRDATGAQRPTEDRPGLAQQQRGATQELRSPDTRDAAEGRGTFNAPKVMVVKVRQPAPAPEPAATSTGIDWGDASIGAGGLLGLTLLAAGGSYALVHRRRQTSPTG